uniref:Putative secreted protein n=1 Tax=Amblyomma tuberculatum TaxID=48802 RepID=A0A6M2E4L9_9ACAR
MLGSTSWPLGGELVLLSFFDTVALAWCSLTNLGAKLQSSTCKLAVKQSELMLTCIHWPKLSSPSNVSTMLVTSFGVDFFSPGATDIWKTRSFWQGLKMLAATKIFVAQNVLEPFIYFMKQSPFRGHKPSSTVSLQYICGTSIPAWQFCGSSRVVPTSRFGGSVSDERQQYDRMHFLDVLWVPPTRCVLHS